MCISPLRSPGHCYTDPMHTVSHTAVLRSNWEQTFWRWLIFFFTVIYNHRKQVLIKFIFNIASSPVSHFQVRSSWISSTYLIQVDLQGPSLAKTDWRCQFKAWFPTSRFQKWIFFISWRMKPFLWWRNQALCSFNSGKLGCRAYFITTLSARGNAAVRSCDKCLLVPTGTAQPVPRFLFKCPSPDTRKGL